MREFINRAQKEIIYVEIATVIEDNIREAAEDTAELDRLAASLEKNQDYPIIIGSNGVVLDGHRRVKAAKRKGLTHLQAIVVEGEVTREEAAAIALRTSVHRKGLTDFERFKAVRLIAVAHPEWSRKTIAQELDLDPPEVTKLLSEGVPEVEEAFRTGEIGLSVRYELAKLPRDCQPVLLAGKLAGTTTRDGLAAQVRRSKVNDKPTARMNRVRCPLPEGTVVVSAASLSLPDTIAILEQALDAARRANKDGLDVRTFQAVLKDKSKKEMKG